MVSWLYSRTGGEQERDPGFTLVPEHPEKKQTKWEQLCEEAWQNKDHIAELVHATKLQDSQKINVLQKWLRVKKETDLTSLMSSMSLASTAVQAVLGALVPILIPLAQYFKGKPLTILGTQYTDAGEAISVCAICCSLLSTMLMVVHRTCKCTDRARARLRRKEKVYNVLQRFLALAGRYHQFGSCEKAYPTLIDELCDIEEDYGESKFFSLDADESTARAQQSVTKSYGESKFLSLDADEGTAQAQQSVTKAVPLSQSRELRRSSPDAIKHIQGRGVTR